MSLRNTMVLTGIFIVLCLAYWGLQFLGDQQERAVLEARRLFDITPESISELEIRQVGRTPATAVREADGLWQIVSPNPTIEAFQPLWNRVAQRLADLINERTIHSTPEASYIAEYGLEEPKLQVYFETDTGDSVQLDFGHMEPTRTFRYALLNKEMIFLVHDNQFFELDRSLDDLRNRFTVEDRDANILRFEFARIWTGREGIEIDDPPEVGEESIRVILERESVDAPWRMISPANAAANQDMVNELVAEVQFLVGRNFVDNPENLSDYGFDPAPIRVTLVDDAKGHEQVLYFGNLDRTTEQGGLFTIKEGRDAVFLVDAHLATMFPRSPYALRERRLLSRKASDLNRIEVSAPNSSFILALDNQKGWQVQEPPMPDASPTELSMYVARLKELSALSFPEGTLADFGLDAPDVVIGLKFSDGDTGQLQFKQNVQSPDFYYGTQDVGDIVRLETALLERLLVDPNHFRSRELMRFSRLDTGRMEIMFEERSYVIEKSHGTWVVREPANRALDNQTDADRLISVLSPLRATGIEADGVAEPSVYGFDQPIFTFSVVVHPEGNSEVVERHGPLEVGGITVDNEMERYARVTGREGVFRVSQDLILQVRDILLGIDAANMLP